LTVYRLISSVDRVLHQGWNEHGAGISHRQRTRHQLLAACIALLVFGSAAPAHADLSAGSFVFDGTVDAIVHDPAHHQTYIGGTFTQERVPAGSAGAGTVLGTIGGLARLQADGSLDTSWHPNPLPAPGEPLVLGALALKAGKLYVGGYFASIGGQSRRNLAAIDTTTGTVTAWNPNPDGGEINGLAATGATVFVSGAFDTIGGQTRSGLAALNTTSGSATTWNPNPAGGGVGVQAIALAGPVLYVGGDFTAIGGQNRKALAAIDTSSGAATAWNPVVAPFFPTDGVYVDALAVSGTSVYIDGNFNYVGGQPRQQLAEVDAATGTPTAWNPGGVSGWVSAFAVTDSSVYIGGGFASIGFTSRRGLAEVDRGAGSPTTWNPNPSDNVAALATSAGKLYVGGSFSNIGGEVTGPFAQLPIMGGGTNEPVDTTPPTIAVTTPNAGQHVPQGATVATVFSCDDVDSGVASCTAPSTLDTASSGSKMFTVAATDNAGNPASRSVAYVVDAPAPPPTPDGFPATDPPPVSPPNIEVHHDDPPPPTETPQPKLLAAASITRGQLRHGLNVTLTGVAPKSRYGATLRVGSRVLATVKGSASANGNARLKFRLSKSTLRQLKGKKTLELRVQIKAANGQTQRLRRTVRIR
jgi:hypothetical protein